MNRRNETVFGRQRQTGKIAVWINRRHIESSGPVQMQVSIEQPTFRDDRIAELGEVRRLIHNLQSSRRRIQGIGRRCHDRLPVAWLLLPEETSGWIPRVVVTIGAPAPV